MKYTHDYKDYYFYTSGFPLKRVPTISFDFNIANKVKEAIPVITAKEALKAVKVDEKWLANWRRKFLKSLSEAEELTIIFKEVVQNEGAPGASTSGSGETPFQISKAPTLTDLDVVDQCGFDPYFLNLDHRKYPCKVASKALSTKDLSTSIINLTELVLDVEPMRQVPFENSGRDIFDYDGPIVINKKRLSSFEGGASIKARVEIKEKVLQLAASRRSISTKRNAEFVDYDKWDKPCPPLMNRVEMTEKLYPQVGTNMLLFLPDLLDQSTTTSCRLEADRIAMMANRYLIYVADAMRTQANVAYELEVLRAEHANAKQRRDEAANALFKANASMEAIVKQKVTESLDKALSCKKRATKMERRGEKYKDFHSTTLTKIKDLKAYLKKAYKESLKMITKIEGENSSLKGQLQQEILEKQEQEAQHTKALEHAFVYSVYTIWQHDKFVLDLFDAEEKEDLMPKIRALEEANKSKEVAQKTKVVDLGTTIPVGDNVDDSALLASNVPISTTSTIPEIFHTSLSGTDVSGSSFILGHSILKSLPDDSGFYNT
uniref:Uncharacterized protein n=1 Tax=Cannabis sativa TaxID=3483 RepID=A0A803NI82_CANSA